MRERIAYGVLDPSAFAVVSGPSIAETLIRNGVDLPPRRQHPRHPRQAHGRLGPAAHPAQGQPRRPPDDLLLRHCRDLIRTLPMMQHDAHNPEDLDTDGEDHAIDDTRYACLSRPYPGHATSTLERPRTRT